MSHVDDLEELPQEEEKGDWYRPGERVQSFHESDAKIRVLVGGRGSGKTTAVAVEVVLKHCWRNAGARVYILRKTATSNQDTTVETFEIVFGASGTAFVDTGLSLFKKVEGGREYRIPTEKAVQMYNQFLNRPGKRPTKAETEHWLDTVGSRWCSWLLFSGVPTAGSRATRFRGFEASMIVLVEADQFDRLDVDYAMACLRWKGTDPAVRDERGFMREQRLILDTNPPGPDHWIARWEEEAKAFDPRFIRFWHIPTEDNRHNLPPDYIEGLTRQYTKNPAMYKRMLLGEYAEAFDGSPVLWSFRQEHAHEDLPFSSGAYLVVAWDFGASANANVFSAYWEEDGCEYMWDLWEHYAESTDTERQCREVRRILDEVFPYHNDRSVCAGVLHFCDPAGAQRRDTGRSLTVLGAHGFYPGFQRAGLQASLSMYNTFLERRDGNGQLVYRVDRKNCPRLYAASSGGYRYPSEGEPGWGGDEPLKGPSGGNYDHIADASRYGKLGVLRLMGAPSREVGVVGRLAAKMGLNRVRKWR